MEETMATTVDLTRVLGRVVVVFLSGAALGCAEPAPAAGVAGSGEVVGGDFGSVTDVKEHFDGPKGLPEIPAAGDAPESDDPFFGVPCEGNKDCGGGLCIAGRDGFACTHECIEDCPTGYACRQVQLDAADVLFACVPLHAELCKPCADALDCSESGDLLAVCRAVGADAGGGSFCATSCAATPCPADYECQTDETSGGQVCVPTSGLCECDAIAKAQALETPCEIANGHGVCQGVRVCGATGLGACDAAVPAAEACNQLDDDCDNLVDEDLADLDQDGTPDCTDPDIDGDAVGNAADCAPKDASIHPGQPEDCNGRDDDCSGVIDDPGAHGCTTWYVDGDSDQFGLDAAPECLCGATPGYAKKPGDCDDTMAAVNPSATEVCDGQDNNCDGKGDAPGLPGCVKWYQDGDNDGHGHSFKWQCLCGAEGSYIATSGDDCDDTSAISHPGAPEACDSEDNDCDGRIDIAASAPDSCPEDCEGSAECAKKCSANFDCTTPCGPGEAI